MKMKILTISVFSILLLSSMIFSNYKHGNRSVYINVNSIVNDSLTLITKDSVFNFLKKKNVIKDSMLTLDVDLNKIENELLQKKILTKSSSLLSDKLSNEIFDLFKSPEKNRAKDIINLLK